MAFKLPFSFHMEVKEENVSTGGLQCFILGNEAKPFI